MHRTAPLFIYMLSIDITVPPDFSFPECYTFINRSSNECLHFASEYKIRKLLKVNSKFILIEISERSKNKISIKFLNTKPDAIELVFVKKFLSEWLDLSFDLATFYQFASKDKLMKKIASKYSGLRMIGIPDLFEALTWAIIGQQINLSFAYSLKKKFVEKYGESYTFEDKIYYIYPAAEIISNLSKDDLLKLQFSKQKADYVIEVARSIHYKKISKKDLKNLDLNEAIDILCEIKGVGNWTANYVMMKCLRNPDAFPIEDVGLHNAIKNTLGLSSKPSIEDIKKLTVNWEGWYAYSTFYLWRSLIN